MYIVREAFERLYPDKELEYELSLRYSGKFKSFNANVRKIGARLEFNLSKNWKTINKEIQIGLIQGLMLKIFGGNNKTQNMDMYDIFMKKIHIAVPKENIDPVLEQSFDKVNDKYFFGMVEKTNLVWGQDSRRKLGSYDYGSDTITISRIFEDSDPRLLDYVMYHEMLHKKHKFKSKNGRSYHHTALFRRKEKEFEDSHIMEKEIRKLIREKSFFGVF